MFILKKKQGESDDKLIARFRKKTIDEGVMQEYRDREHYKKPAEKRKEVNFINKSIAQHYLEMRFSAD